MGLQGIECRNLPNPLAWTKLNKIDIRSFNITEGKVAEKEIYDLGDKPPLGQVPKQMHAFAVRQDRFGPPKDAWKREVIDVPELGSKDVLVYVMATGINYNNVWAALGYPIDVIAIRQKKGAPEAFHAGG